MFGESFWPAVGFMLVLLWLGPAVAGNSVYRVWAARLGSLAFLGYALYLGSTMNAAGMDWLAVLMTAAVVGGLVYGGSQIALPVFAAAWGGTVGRAVFAWRSWNSARQAAADERRRRRESEEFRRRSQEEYERAAPERERQRQAEERRRELAARDAKRRKDARAACELAYSRCAVEIGNRFSRQELERFMATYMAEDHSADDVERRGEELRKMMEDYRQPPKVQKKPRTIQDLAEWYLREKQSIEGLPLDDLVRQEHLVALDMRFDELTQEVLQSMEP